MQLRYLKNIIPSQDGMAKISAMAWAPNNTKLAVCTAERVVVLFDENGEKRDKFSTKPIESKYGKKSYLVRAMVFSPDSTKLAVGQTDNIVFVYKIGESWGEKKVICNKFVQQSPVLCLIWLSSHGIVLGLLDGKVRSAQVKTNKSSTIYGTGNQVISLAESPDGQGFLSGHADGSIVRYLFQSGGQQAAASGKICMHPSPPYCLIWSPNSIVAAGCDKRVFSYNKEGRVLQQFDYSNDEHEKELCSIALSPGGQSVAIGSFDRIRLFNYNSKKGGWEEGKLKEIKYLYTILCLAWKPDGSRVVAGTLNGAVEMFDCALKRSMLRSKFEITHVGPSQVIVKNIEMQQSVVLKSQFGLEIQEVKVLGNDRYVMAHTSDHLLIADFVTGNFSEVSWSLSGNEKFYFQCENLCMIFNAGELSLVEYGNNDIVGSVRTEFTNPHLISVRINERKYKGHEEIKKMAYLIDLKTISIIDLLFNTTINTVHHDSKIDWLELNETARKLLFRDKRSRLMLFDLETEAKHVLLSYCAYVQWVPRSDVVVAQSRDNLCIWYNIEDPEKVTQLPINGDIVDLVREEGKTDVFVDEGNQHSIYTLDEGLIEFGTAMEDADFLRAVTYLEELELSPETHTMWKQLARTALDQRHLLIAQRCYAALGDIARVRFIRETNRIAKEAAQHIGGDGSHYYKVRARLAIMDKNFAEAERIYLEQNALDEAIQMYQELHQWDEALQLAIARNHPDVDALKAKYLRHLAETGQDEKAGELREKEGDFMAAIDLYLKSNMPSRAARVITEHANLINNKELVDTAAVALIKSDLFEKAGDLFEKTKDFERALQCYQKGKAFGRAVELARYAFPQEVIGLEEKWGDLLLEQKQTGAAINHYIESGNSKKALDAAVKARQWTRAVEIVEILDNPELAKEYYGIIAEYYASIQEFERAERFYIEAGQPKDAIDMYNKAGKWDQAHRLANEFMQQDESSDMYINQAKGLQQQGRFREAERLYTAINKPNLAIAMYKEIKDYDQMMRLIEQFYPDRSDDTHLHIAKEMEEGGNLREAEHNYLGAKEWKSAVNMYRQAGQWEDAHRVAKEHGGDTAAKQVAYMWAKSLGGDSAVKLLQRFGLLEESIDFAAENGAFEFAFELCRLGMKPKIGVVHQKYAQQLEEEGQYEKAEQEYLSAGKPKEAVMMYIHKEDWDSAQRVAEKHSPESITDVYIGQARSAFEQRDYPKAESYLLRAQKPEIIVKSYKEMGMWQDALRVCKEYLPNLYPQLQNEFDDFNLRSGAKGAESFMVQAQDWEKQGEYARAIDCYLKINRQVTNDKALMEKSWTKAAELAIKFIFPENHELGTQLIQQIAQQLIEIQNFNGAAELYLQVDMVQGAVDAFMAGGEWKKAKKVAAQMEPELETYVDEKYKEYLRNEGRTDQLANVDAMGAIDIFIDKGQWEKALETAKEQNNGPLLDKYVTLYAAEKMKESKLADALAAFNKYGTPANPQNFNLYKRLADDIIASKGLDTPEGYSTWGALREMLLKLINNFKGHKEAVDARYEQIFERYLLIAHYYATRSAVQEDASLQLIGTKLSISLLRHSDLIPADKAFYEAGTHCKDQGGPYERMAFQFLNQYLDLIEAIEEKNPDLVDYSQFAGTDIPAEIPLPDNQYLTPQEHEEVKEWVLAISVDKQIERELILDRRGVYEASLVAAGSVYSPCVITGYPVLESVMHLGSSDKVANRDDWSKFQISAKMAKSANMKDVLKFISEWTGHPLTAI